MSPMVHASTGPEAATLEPGPHGPAFWIGLTLGGAVIVFAAVNLIAKIGLGGATDVAAWVIGADLAHDVVIAPLVIAVGLTIARWVPALWRWPIRAGAIASAISIAIAYPALRGFGRDTAPGNETVQPLDYPTALATVLAVIWGIAIVWGISSSIRAVRARA